MPTTMLGAIVTWALITLIVSVTVYVLWRRHTARAGGTTTVAPLPPATPVPPTAAGAAQPTNPGPAVATPAVAPPAPGPRPAAPPPPAAPVATANTRTWSWGTVVTGVIILVVVCFVGWGIYALSTAPLKDEEPASASAAAKPTPIPTETSKLTVVAPVPNKDEPEKGWCEVITTPKGMSINWQAEGTKEVLHSDAEGHLLGNGEATWTSRFQSATRGPDGEYEEVKVTYYFTPRR